MPATSLITKTKSYFFSSDPANGALNVSPDGSTFQVQLDRPITLPQCEDATLTVTQANIWNTSPNISTLIGNNKLYVHSDHVTVPASPTDFTITIPDGSYSVEGLNNLIAREVTAVGYPSDLVAIAADDATQKVIVTFAYASTWLDFTQPDNCRDVLGFDARLVPLTPQAAGYTESGDNVAAFNRINTYLIKTSLVSNGISVNNLNESIIAEIPITVKPGSLIVYQPFNPPSCSAMELTTHQKSQMDFRLTDQIGRTVETLGEAWSITIELRYTMWV